MTEFFLGLIPDYGLYVVFCSVLLAGFAIPLPSSMVVLAAGGFAAVGDINVWHLIGICFTAFMIADQIAFQIARLAGDPLLNKIRSGPRMGAMINRSETMVNTHGVKAVVLSHTLLSPTVPYVNFLCGAGTMSWRAFSVAASIGAALWTSLFVAVGFLFSGRLPQLTGLTVDIAIMTAALTVATVLFLWLHGKWKQFEQSSAATPKGR